MTQKQPLILMMQAGGHAARIIGFEKGIVYVDGALPITPADGEGQLSWRQGALGAAIDVALAPADSGIIAGRPGIGYRVLGPRNALTVLGKMALAQGMDRWRHLLALDIPPRPRPEAPVARTSLRLVAGFAAATLLFGAITLVELHQRMFTFDAEIARVAAAGAIVRADKAGRVVYLTENAQVTAGEPVAGVRTRSGYEQPFVTPVSGKVTGVLVHTGDSVTVGEPVLIVSPPGERPTVLARIATADAVRLARGFTAQVTYGDGVTETLPVGPDDVVPLGASGGSSRVDVRLHPAADLTDRVGEPVHVRFVAAAEAETAGATLSDLARAVALAGDVAP
jgi:hypothetical protein